jgi:DNA-binding transcriptional LysR family regulator
MEIYFRDQRIAPHLLMEMTSNETIKQAVIANMGLSFLSLHTVGLELRAGELRTLKVDGLPLLRRWHVVQARAKILSPVAEAFRYYVLERGERFLAEMFGSPTGPTEFGGAVKARSEPNLSAPPGKGEA